MNRFQEVKTLLDDEIEICKYQLGYEDLRKIIDRLKRDNLDTQYIEIIVNVVCIQENIFLTKRLGF